MASHLWPKAAESTPESTQPDFQTDSVVLLETVLHKPFQFDLAQQTHRLAEGFCTAVIEVQNHGQSSPICPRRRQEVERL